MSTRRILYRIACCVLAAAMALPAEAQNNGESSVRKFGRRFKDAITDTYRDAVSAIRGESAGDRQSGRSQAANDGPTYYVSAATGSNRAEGTLEAPFKNIQKALEVVPDGAVILVAEGNYFGTLRSGNINVDKPVTVLGGYNDSFTERDILRYRTVVRPSVASNETQSGKGTLQIRVRRPETKVTVDGLLFDRGWSIAYDPSDDEKPDGVASGRMQTLGIAGLGGERLDEETKTAQTAEIFLDNCQCEVEIRNCAFINAPDCAIKGSVGAITLLENNIFVCVRKAAVEISGSMLARNADIRFSRNTVLFAWPSGEEDGELGFAYRFMNGANSYLDHNVLGCCSLAALDRCRVETIREKEAQKVTSAEYNVFFHNPLGDIALPGGDRPLLVEVRDFEDVDQLTGVRGNRDTNDPDIFGDALDEAYFEGFRSGKMYMNRYDFEKALRLFGAVEGFGAQVPAPEAVVRPAGKTTNRNR